MRYRRVHRIGFVVALTAMLALSPLAGPVTSDPAKGGPDDGKVVFCNREVQLTSPDVIDLFLRTRESHAFQWGALNVGNQVHTLEVKAHLDVLVTGGGAAEAAVGKRVLIMEPVHLEHDAAF